MTDANMTQPGGGQDLYLVAIYLRGLRERIGVKQVELAKTMGISQRHLSRWETGETQLGSEPLLKAILALPVSIAHLDQLMRGGATVEVAERLAEERLRYIHTQARLHEEAQQKNVEDLMTLMAALDPDELAALRVFLRERAAQRTHQ